MLKFDKEKLLTEFKDFYITVLKSRLDTEIPSLAKLLDFIIADDEWQDHRHIANFLAQVGHETAWTYAPIKEYRAKAGTKARKNQDRYWKTGYYGRGYIQLTWDYNYETFSKILGIDLVNNPDLAYQPDTAYIIASKGLREGLFTGGKRGLAYFIPIGEVKANYAGARSLVNGTDKKDLIAKYSVKIQKMIENSAINSEDLINEPTVNEEVLKDAEISEKELYDDVPDTPEPVQMHDWKTKVSGWKARIVAAISAVTGLGISGTTLTEGFGFLKGIGLNTTVWKVVGISALVIVALVVITYMINRTMILINREKLDTQLKLKQMEIYANPDLTNVELIRDENNI